jgi:hypothetical protein
MPAGHSLGPIAPYSEKRIAHALFAKGDDSLVHATEVRRACTTDFCTQMNPSVSDEDLRPRYTFSNNVHWCLAWNGTLGKQPREAWYFVRGGWDCFRRPFGPDYVIPGISRFRRLLAVMLSVSARLKRKGQKADAGCVDVEKVERFSAAKPVCLPDAGEVNEALRALAGIIHEHRPRRADSRRGA